MSDPIPSGVVITLREVYDSIQRLDAKMTQLTWPALAAIAAIVAVAIGLSNLVR